MRKKLTPSFIELTQDACLKAFWRKPALRLFLQQHQISQTQLATWHGDESKRVFLNRLFPELLQINDNSGHAAVLEMARSLAEMKHFPDLEGWEDSAEKISAAHNAVARIKLEVNRLNRQVRDTKNQERRRKEASERQQEILAAEQSLQKLSDSLTELIPIQGTQEGGYAFEQWFYDLTRFFEITSRPRYNVKGRQIDGSLSLEGTTYLVETKFTKVQTGVTDVDSFMSKIMRMADNTMGIFVSMAGFSKVAIDGASRDRTPMLLLDYSHIYNLILSGSISLPGVIQRIKRHASQTGDALLPIKDF
ncbi:MAG: restriction endonuclease [candidate division Zixibacteria bacterium]|nr:restriction endonuclease [candidate division Zixibacteria bacterium]